MTAEDPQDKIRIDEDQVLVALRPEDFDQKVRAVLQDTEVALIERVVYVRGDLPQQRLWVDRLWWALGILGGFVFLYGFYSLVLKGLKHFVG